MTPTKAEQLAARTSPVHQPAHGWTDADADAARLALELECILTDRDTPMPLTSRWWESAHEALALHRQRIDDELREIECPPDPDAVDRALEAEALQDEAAAELRRLSAVEAERDALRVDAERYRWLRERYPTLTREMPAKALGLDLRRLYVNTREKFDAAIDAAMKDHP